jgi:DNA-binding response OmpR family regulator
MARGDCSRARILVVVDDPDFRHVLVEVLGQEGYAVATVSDRRAALGRVTEDAPRAVLLDLRFAEVDGADIVCFQTMSAHAPVVLLSARPPAELAALAEAVGAAGWLRKPFDLDDVLRVVAALVVGAGPAGGAGAEPSMSPEGPPATDLAGWLWDTRRQAHPRHQPLAVSRFDRLPGPAPAEAPIGP